MRVMDREQFLKVLPKYSELTLIKALPYYYLLVKLESGRYWIWDIYSYRDRGVPDIQQRFHETLRDVLRRFYILNYAYDTHLALEKLHLEETLKNNAKAKRTNK